MAMNIAAISGTSVSSSSGWYPRRYSSAMKKPVDAITKASTASVGRVFHTRKP